ncbi:MAG: hypothetical protein KGI33_01960 [Thaumarchaeota archaeon]|nr:hypothetical protein [Nitrososphaerota archaeon]
MQELAGTLRGAKLYALIAGICVAGAAGIAFGLEASSHFATPGYVPPPAVAPKTGHCFSFELNCNNPVTHAKSFYTTGAYLDQPAS